MDILGQQNFHINENGNFCHLHCWKETQPQFECVLCFTDFIIEDIITYGNSIIQEGQIQCSHRACKDCLKRYIKQEYQKMKQSKNFTLDLSCMEEDCQIKMDPNVIQQQFKDLYEEINQNCILHNNMSYKQIHINKNRTVIYQCQKCSLPFGQEIGNFKYIIQIKCPRCQYQMCSNCKKPYHGNKKCTNPYEFKYNILMQLKSNLSIHQHSEEERLKIRDIRVCPNSKCNTPYVNPQNCEHVDCLECQWSWCFQCSVLRNPTMVHDNSYHREGCPYYDDHNFVQKCKSQECLKEKCQSEFKTQKKCISSDGHYCIECYIKNIDIKQIENHTVCDKPESYQAFIQSIFKKFNIGEESNYDQVIRRFMEIKKKKKKMDDQDNEDDEDKKGIQYILDFMPIDYNFDELIKDLDNNKYTEIEPPQEIQPSIFYQNDPELQQQIQSTLQLSMQQY